MNGFCLDALGMVNALGEDLDSIAERLFRGDANRLVPHVLRTTGERVPVGRVRADLPSFPEGLRRFECRNHGLALMAYSQVEASIEAAKARWGASRIGVVLGSSTSGLDASEAAYFHWKKEGRLPPSYRYDSQHDMGSISRFVARLADVGGPAYTVSTACSSSGKAFASARGLLELDICDAVITGGVDALCHLTLNGFESLASLSRSVSNPFSRNRDGLNIGEGAALFLLSRNQGGIRLMGIGESCDAYHMSAPHPEGLGAEAAMRGAIEDAGIGAEAIAYLNLHGTGTPLNDAMEAKAVDRVLGAVPCGSTKPLTGHCLGGASAVEVGFCWLALRGADGGRVRLPPHTWDGQTDDRFPQLNLVAPSESLDARGNLIFMSNSFAFGGNNCSLVLGRELDEDALP